MNYEFREEDAYSFARNQGIETKISGNELMFKTCPYCRPKATKGNTRTFSINLSTGQFKCLRASCGVTGNMVTIAKDFGFSLGTEVDEYYSPKKRYKRLKTPDNPIVPKPRAIEYLNSRGISESTAKRYEITNQTEHENVLVFPFYDENGKLQFVKYRNTKYDPDKNESKEWCEKDCKPILFGMKQCVGFKRLIVTEGQIDSLSVAEAGLDNAVSVPTGCNGFTWVPYCWDWVSKFEEIVVFGDFEKNHMTLLDDFKRRFPNKIKAVQESNYLGCKDANEILRTHGKKAILDAVENAQPLPVRRVKDLSDVKQVDIYKLPKLKTGLYDLDKILHGGFPFGQVHIIAGKRGDGKSTLASELVVNATEQGYRSFVYSGELPTYLFKSWFDFQTAGKNHIIESSRPDGSVSRIISDTNSTMISNWYHEKVFVYDTSIIDDDEQEDLLKTIKDSIMQYGTRVILIDNLMTAIDLDAEEGSNTYDRQGRFVKKLAKIALRFDVAIFLVAHKRKNNYSTDANDEISGSGDISNLAGVIISYDRDNELEPSKRRLIVSKNRLIGKLELTGYILSYDEKSKRIYGEKDDLNFQYGWDKSDGFVSVDEEETPFD